MNTDDGAVNRGEFQIHFTEIVFHLNECLENLRNGPVHGQSEKTLVNGVPITEFLGHIAPRGTGFENPKNSIDIASFIVGRPSDGGINHQFLQDFPLRIGERVTMNQSWTCVGHEFLRENLSKLSKKEL